MHILPSEQNILKICLKHNTTIHIHQPEANKCLYGWMGYQTAGQSQGAYGQQGHVIPGWAVW
jgi:hypothetical protein